MEKGNEGGYKDKKFTHEMIEKDKKIVYKLKYSSWFDDRIGKYVVYLEPHEQDQVIEFIESVVCTK